MSFTFVCAIAVVFLVMSLVGATESAPVFGLLIGAHQARRTNKSAFGAYIIISSLVIE